MPEYSAEEVAQKHSQELGPELGPVFHRLWQEVNWLTIVWHEYLELYGPNEKRLEILNGSSPFFFAMIQTSMWHEVLLRIRRITDPPTMGGKENLTVHRLAALCPDSDLSERVAGLARYADEVSSFAKDWRNRKIAHADLALSLNSKAHPLPPASQGQVEESITAVHAVLNAISRALMSSEMLNKPIIGPVGAENLLYLLRDGIEAQADRKRRIMDGTYVRRGPL